MGKIKNRPDKVIQWLIALAVVVGSVSLVLIGSTTADPVISQGYNTSDSLSTGTIVSIKAGSKDTVSAANLSNANSLIGVVIGSNNSQVALTSGTNQVQVATSGVNQVLVSDINGKIKAGDEIAASPINGVGMLATQSAEIIGDAQGSFPNQTASKQSVTNASGTKQSINIGSMPVLVSIGYYTKQPTKTIIPEAIQNLANALAGKQVKALPIILSVGIFLVTLIAVVSIVYSMVHGSIISVGRNPMAQSAVYRNVLQLSALVVGIIAVCMFAIFMILTKVG